MLTLWKVKLKHKRVRCCSIVGTDGFGMQFRCQHVPAAGVAAAQECCVRNTDNASFLQFHDRNSIRQKKDSDITGIVGEIPDVACRAGA